MLLINIGQLKAQLHIASGVELYVSGSSNLYSAESFSNSGKLTIAAGTTAILDGGSASGAGTIKGTSTSNLSIGGTSTSGTYNFDQTTLGTTNVLKNLTLTGSATATVNASSWCPCASRRAARARSRYRVSSSRHRRAA